MQAEVSHPPQFVCMKASVSPTTSVRLYAGPCVPTHVNASYPPQLVYMQANASPSTSVCRHAADMPPTTPTRPYASKRVPSDTSTSALRQTRPWPRQQVRKQAKHVPSHTSASICRQTYTNASASALHREYFFFYLFRFTNHVLPSSLALSPLSNYIIHVDIHVVVLASQYIVFMLFILVCQMYWLLKYHYSD